MMTGRNSEKGGRGYPSAVSVRATSAMPAPGNGASRWSPPVLGDAVFSCIAELVSERTGIVLKENKKDMVKARLTRRLRTLGLPSFEAYCRRLRNQGNEGEIVALVNSLTTNLTAFFREPHHFDHLLSRVLQPLAARHRQNPHGGGRPPRLRLWSAGCSSGEEAYSMAMQILGAIPDPGRWDARILATDIDTTMLDRARAGRYPREAVAALPPRFFDQTRGDAEGLGQSPEAVLQIKDKLRRLIAFKYLNLIADWPMKGPFDAIFCRNVLIYHGPDTRRRIIEGFARLLRPGSWLYIGHSENLFEFKHLFAPAGRTIYRRLDTVGDAGPS